MIDEKKVLKTLQKCWSLESSSLWTKNNPAKGQCGVTALVINDLFGGDILKTRLQNGQLHFYNLICDNIYDLTKSQFDVLPNYDNTLSKREEAFLDTNEKQYNYLRENFEKSWVKIL